MRLFDRLRGISDPVPGTFHLVACTPSSTDSSTCLMDGVVTGADTPPTVVHHVSMRTPGDRWPDPGQDLPVTFQRGDPTRLTVRWQEVPTTAETVHQLAEDAAEAMRASAAAPHATSVIGAADRPLPGTPGGGLTPQQGEQAAAGGAAALGLAPATARVIAAHRIDIPAELPQAPGGTWDLTLDITPATGAGWSAVLRVNFSSSARRTSYGSVGRVLPVYADPVQHDRVAIATDRLPPA